MNNDIKLIEDLIKENSFVINYGNSKAYELGEADVALIAKSIVKKLNLASINKWVAIEDSKKPELCSDVLVCFNDGSIECHYFDGDSTFYNERSDRDITDRIIYWMALPKPPCC